MKTKFLLLGIVFTIFSCGKSLEGHLAQGLTSIEHTRLIEHTFKDNYTIDKMVFLKEEGQTFNLILKLSEDSSKDVIEAYSLGIHVYAKNENAQKATGERIKQDYTWDFKPVLEISNKHKYIIRQIETPIKRIDSMRLFLYDRDKYKKKSYGKGLWVKNLGL